MKVKTANKTRIRIGTGANKHLPRVLVRRVVCNHEPNQTPFADPHDRGFDNLSLRQGVRTAEELQEPPEIM